MDQDPRSGSAYNEYEYYRKHLVYDIQAATIENATYCTVKSTNCTVQ